ncbi:MAG: hypothetical protein Q9168_008117 [Polycauliona sp. 1 TL-2023]
MAHQASVSSVADGAAALASGCEDVAKGLYDLAERHRDVDSRLSSIAQELSATQSAWQLIRNLTDRWRSHAHLSQDLLLRLDQSIAWGRLILAALDDDMTSCYKRLDSAGDGFRSRFTRSRVIWSESSLKRHQERIKSQTKSMGLLISILKMSDLQPPVSPLDHIPTTRFSLVSELSMVPSRNSVRPPDTDRLGVFDDMMYNQLTRDNDLFTSGVNKRKFGNSAPTRSSSSRHSTAQTGNRRSSLHVASQMKSTTQQHVQSTDKPSVEASSPIFDNLNPFAAGYLDTIQENQTERRHSSFTGESILDPDDLLLSYYAANPPQPDADSRLVLDEVLSSLQDSAKLETIIGGRPTPAMTEAIHMGDLEGVLLDGCRNGNTRLVEELLDAGVNVHCRRKEVDDRMDGSAPIHLAAMYGQAQIATILFQHHACVNDYHHSERRPLHEAAEAGYETMTALLLEHGARPHLRDGQGLEPLHLACQHGSMKVASLLLEAGASVNSADNHLYRPLHHLAQECDDPYLATLLMDLGTDIDATTDQGYTAVQLACISGNVNVLSALLQHGASMTYLQWSASPLNLAIRGAHLKVTQLLLRYGAPVNDMDPLTHTTVSHLIIKEPASSRMVKKLLKLLLEYGMDINAQDSEGNTSLHMTIGKLPADRSIEWQLVVVKGLLMSGADTGFANYFGDYPLDLAHRSTLVKRSYDLRLFRLLVAASVHHLPSRELARIESDMRCSEAPANRSRAKEMVALLGAARIKNDLVM